MAAPVERIDNDDKGEFDDVAVSDVSMFRMEWMNRDTVWIRLYRDQKGRDDLVFWLKAKKGKLVCSYWERD